MLVRPLRKYGVTESIATIAILFSRMLESKIYIMFGGSNVRKGDGSGNFNFSLRIAV